MARISSTLILLILSCLPIYAQVGSEQGLFAQLYSKEITEYKVKVFIADELIDQNENEPLPVTIESLTASSTGELTTVFYENLKTNEKGLIFAFYEPYVNDYNLKYKGYAFRHFSETEALEMLELVENVKESDSLDVYSGDDKNVFVKYKDINFLFYRDSHGLKKIRVLWKSYFDADWNDSNLNKVIRRFKKRID